MIKTTYTKIYPFILFSTCILLLNACSSSRKTGRSNTTSIPQKEQAKNNADKKVDGILWFAKQQLGTPYKYGSSDPKKGDWIAPDFFTMCLPISIFPFLAPPMII